MTATYAEALDQIQDLFTTAWLANGTSAPFPIQYWDIDTPDPSAVDGDNNPPTFARIMIFHTNFPQVTLSNEGGASRYRAEGLVTVQVRTPKNDGQILAAELVEVVLDAFRKASTPGDILFRNVRPNEVGRNGIHFQTDVLADFEYDQVI